jgi:small subunit ribosomal protein S16
MVRIRLRRSGAKKQPTYRFVVADARAPRDGRFIEILGHYNPRTEPRTVVVDEERARRWLAKGAQPSETVRRLFAERGIMERGPIPTAKRKPKKAEGGTS